MNLLHSKQNFYRRDIDGLRAISILLVLAYHAFPEVIPGGYIGVDIFFVISGYLITKIILEEINNQSFSLLNFYSRRIKRIFPALILVLFSALLFGWFFLTADELKNLSGHIIAGAIFSSNLLLLKEAGYFDASAELKPLLHLWSLGIEEQFYILWPLLLIFFKNTKFKLILTVICIGLSFSLNIYLIQESVTSSFYLPFSRFWQMWLGAIMAMQWDQINILIKKVKSYFIYLGFFLIALGVMLLSKISSYPGWWALLPTFGAVFIILGNSDSFLNTVLTNKLIVGIGLISYPLYLWHWPILSYLHIANGHAPSIHWRIAALILTFILAIFTYFIVEKRVRANSKKYLPSLLILLIFVVGTLGYLIHNKNGFESRYKKIIHVDQSFKADFLRWEDTGLVPNVDCVNSFKFPKWKVCLQSNDTHQPTAALIGDSHAFHAYWGVSELFKKNENLILLGQGACLPFINLSDQLGGTKCAESIDKLYKYILNEKSIKTVFISHRFFYINHESTSKQIDLFERSVDETFSQLKDAGKKIVYLKSVPEPVINPKLCVGGLPWGRALPKEACDFLHQADLDRQKNYRLAIDRVLQKYQEVIVFDPRDYLCEITKCSLVIDGKVMFMDENHLSRSGSLFLGRRLASYLDDKPNK